MTDSPEPEVPDIGEYLWSWFWKLDAVRQHSDNGPCAIDYSEIQAWMHCTNTAASPSEIDALMRIDQSYRASMRNEIRAQRERQQQKQSKGAGKGYTLN